MVIFMATCHSYTIGKELASEFSYETNGLADKVEIFVTTDATRTSFEYSGYSQLSGFSVPPHQLYAVLRKEILWVGKINVNNKKLFQDIEEWSFVELLALNYVIPDYSKGNQHCHTLSSLTNQYNMDLNLLNYLPTSIRNRLPLEGDLLGLTYQNLLNEAKDHKYYMSEVERVNEDTQALFLNITAAIKNNPMIRQNKENYLNIYINLKTISSEEEFSNNTLEPLQSFINNMDDKFAKYSINAYIDIIYEINTNK